MTSTIDIEPHLAGEQALALMQTIATWQNTTTIIVQSGCVFEFKGVFPAGEVSEGYYNLHNNGSGFEGHIGLQAIARIRFQSRAHRGRDSHAFVFENSAGACIFKVFLGRDGHGQIHAEQLSAYHAMQSTAARLAANPESLEPNDEK